MKVLITNDDGIFSEGLEILVKKLQRYFDVSVVVPDGERSGAGHAITLLNPLRVRRVRHSPFDGIDAWMVDGTPMDCVILAVDELVKDISVVVSGINNGFNLGDDIFHSGTVSAAMEGTLLGFPSIAISAAPDGKENFEVAADIAYTAVLYVVKNGLPDMTFLNINVPKWSKGVRLTKQGRRRYIGKVHKYKDPRGLDCYWIGGKIEDEGESGTDVDAVKNGFVSITPVRLDVTDYTLLGRMESLQDSIEKRYR